MSDMNNPAEQSYTAQLLAVLRKAVALSAVGATKRMINQGILPPATDSKSREKDWCVRLEWFSFFIHTMNRYAFELGDDYFRARLQEEVLRLAAESLYGLSFKFESENEGQVFMQNILAQAADQFDKADEEYSSCDSLDENLSRGGTAENSVLHRLAQRMAALLGVAPDTAFEDAIAGIAGSTLEKSGIKLLVETLYGTGEYYKKES